MDKSLIYDVAHALMLRKAYTYRSRYTHVVFFGKRSVYFCGQVTRTNSRSRLQLRNVYFSNFQKIHIERDLQSASGEGYTHCVR